MEVPRLVAIAILTSGRFAFMERRPDSGALPGLWQFPGGKVEFGEHPWDALRRELWEERRLRIGRGSLFGVYSHVYEMEGERVHYVLLAYRVNVARDRIKETEEAGWIGLSALRKLPVVPGTKPIVADLLRRGRRRIT